MMGFLFALIVVGSLGSLVAIGDPKHATLAPYIGFVCLFAGLGALCLSWGLVLVSEALHSETLSGLGFFGGYAVGGLGGGVWGFSKAYRHRARLRSDYS
ncbi:MAG TPA: hypothetical protein VF658_12690 [Pyrinomonadaceae bacterium]